MQGKQLRLKMSPFLILLDVSGLCAPSVFIPDWNHVHAEIDGKQLQVNTFLDE